MSENLPNPSQLALDRLCETRRLKFEAYEKESALLGTVKGADEVALNRRLSNLEAEIEQLDRQIEQMEHNLNAAQVEQLIDHLRDCFTENPQVIKKAFINSLPQNAWCCRKNYDSIRGLVTDLATVGKYETLPYSSLVCFVGCLLLDANVDIPLLRDWLVDELHSNSSGETSKDVNDVLSWAQSHQAHQQDSESCLLVQVSYVAQASSQEGQRQYRLQGWYIDDIEAYRKDYGTALRIDLPNESTHSFLTFEAAQLENRLQALIAALPEESDLPKSLQIFLPSELMGVPVDTWCSEEDGDEGSTFSLDHEGQVYIRCEGRLTDRKLRRSDWEQRWQTLQDSDQPPTEHFVALDGQNATAMERKIKREKQKIGLTLPSSQSQSATALAASNSIFKRLSKLPIPVVMWLREPHQTLDCQVCLSELLDCAYMREIPDRVVDKRLADDLDHLGQHLSFVWDDPSLLPPGYQRPKSA